MVNRKSLSFQGPYRPNNEKRKEQTQVRAENNASASTPRPRTQWRPFGDIEQDVAHANNAWFRTAGPYCAWEVLSRTVTELMIASGSLS